MAFIGFCVGQTHTQSFVPQCAQNFFSMSDDEVRLFLDSLMSCYNCEQNPYTHDVKITPKFESDDPQKAYLKWDEGIKEKGQYVWSRLSIENKNKDDWFAETIFLKSFLLEYLFNNKRFIVSIVPAQPCTYEIKEHQTNVGFSGEDGMFSIKKTPTQSILMVSHYDSQFREARILKHHGNCDYDRQFGEMMIRLKNGRVITLTNIHPLHTIDCNGNHCHYFIDQFDLTGINVSEIIKIRLSDATDNYDFENEYMSAMLELMIKAATKNLEESLKANEF